MKEIWKNIKDYEKSYKVSNLGNVKSLAKNKILKHTLWSGYPNLTLSKNNKKKGCQIHRLVAQAFIPNPNNLRYVNHKDFDRTNNNVDNLEWCTQRYNVNYSSERMKKPKSVVTSNTGEKYITYCARKSKKNGKVYSYMKYRLTIKSKNNYCQFNTLQEAVEKRNLYLGDVL